MRKKLKIKATMKIFALIPPSPPTWYWLGNKHNKPKEGDMVLIRGFADWQSPQNWTRMVVSKVQNTSGIDLYYLGRDK